MHTWQFNFKFNLHEDTYAQESIDLLINSGIDFEMHQKHGIDVSEFGELLIGSGLVLTKHVTWISFHSGYDFGYLLKVLMAVPLPPDEAEFLKFLKIFFPRFFDIKFLIKSCKNLKGGLQDVADDLGVSRIGIQHQAGSDSHLTCSAFFKLRQIYFENFIEETKFLNSLYGIGSTISFNYNNPSELSSNNSSFLTSNAVPDANSVLLETPQKNLNRK